MVRHAGSQTAHVWSGSQNTALLIGDWAHEAEDNFGEVLKCHGRHIQVLEYDGPPVLVERMVIGVGDHCNAPHCFECVPWL